VDILEVVVDFIHESKALRLMGRAEKNDGAIRLPLTAVADLGALAAAGIPYALHPAKGPSMGIEEDDAPTMSM
jgi:hypothetical protein